MNIQGLNLQTSVDLLRAVILHELGLDDNRVMIYNQKLILPTDEKLFVVVEFKFSRVISSAARINDDGEGGLSESQEILTVENLNVAVMSRGLDALRRKEEVAMSLVSLYSQEIQNGAGFHISRIAPIEDASFPEASAMFYRFDIPVVMLSRYQKEKSADFYDTFNAEIRTESVVEEFVQPVPEEE